MASGRRSRPTGPHCHYRFFVDPANQASTRRTRLLKLGIVEPAALRAHYQRPPLGEREVIAAGRNLTALLRELGADL
jgi:hypothetical protein